MKNPADNIKYQRRLLESFVNIKRWSLELDLKRQNNSCFANTLFNVDLKVYQANLDYNLFLRSDIHFHIHIQIYIYIYIYIYISKADGFESITEAANERFVNNIHQHDTMEAIAKAYLSYRERSIQASV